MQKSEDKATYACPSKHYASALFLMLFFYITSLAQVGINTNDPKGALDITSTNNTGLVLPRVTAIENVTDGSGNPPVNGTTVYDISRNTTCFYQNNAWICIDVDASGNPILTNESINPYDSAAIDYIKSSNSELGDLFGFSVALSGDGNTLAVSALGEASSATGINGDQSNNTAFVSGAVYVFTRAGGIWSQQAYIKASNTEFSDQFGYSLALSNDGNTLAVSSFREDSNAAGINGDQTDNSLTDSGAVYIFNRTASTWAQQAYIKASNPDSDDYFGNALALSDDGNTLAVGAEFEDSNATGINGIQSDNSALNSGAVYVFTRLATVWTQQAYIKASNTNNADVFGNSVTLSQNGNTLAVGAYNESSDATGINGNQASNLMPASGAVYVFVRSGSTWTQQAYIKASNSESNDRFGFSVSLSNDATKLAISATGEDSNATGEGGDQANNTVTNSGAVYIFDWSGTAWTQEAYIKAGHTNIDDLFGLRVAFSGDASTLVVSANGEDSNAVDVNGNPTNNSTLESGAAYVFQKSGSVWTQKGYLKATNTDAEDNLGYSIGISNDGLTIALGTPFEDCDAVGINPGVDNNFGSESGAVYVYNFN